MWNVAGLARASASRPYLKGGNSVCDDHKRLQIRLDRAAHSSESLGLAEVAGLPDRPAELPDTVPAGGWGKVTLPK